MNPILPVPLVDLLVRQSPDGSSGRSSGGGAVLNPKEVGASGGATRVLVCYDTHLPALYFRDGEKLRTLLAGTFPQNLHGHVL